jgi:hypothetical protein
MVPKGFRPGLAAYRTAEGSYSLSNEFHYLIARTSAQPVLHA